MSAEEYWEGESDLVIYYRQAEKQRQKQHNYYAWLHGRYIYDALICVAPILNGFVKRPKVRPYPEPYELKGTVTEEEKQAKEDKQMRNGIEHMRQAAARINQKFQKK